jgi:hypothetical protein
MGISLKENRQYFDDKECNAKHQLMITLNQLPSGLGAQFGRPEIHDIGDPHAPFVFLLERHPLMDGCYDKGGAYWGGPDNFYVAQCSGNIQGEHAEILMFLRAESHDEAKKKVRLKYPLAHFQSSEFTPFVDGYVKAALLSTIGDSDDHKGMPLDETYTLHDLSAECFQSMTESCKLFQDQNESLLSQAYNINYSQEQAGKDFWFDRCRHGSGFEHRDLGSVGKKLTEAASGWTEVDLYVGDDGKIYGETLIQKVN